MTAIQSPKLAQGINGRIQSYSWAYQGQNFNVVYETLGEGDPVLLLPAFSTVSTRTEMAGIAQILAAHFQVVALDWLGFGDSDRPPLQYGRSLYQQLLADFVGDCVPQPVAIVAAGHAAGYGMNFAAHHPESCSKLILIAPTWKGPLRAMGVPIPIATGLKNTIRLPLLGQVLYGMNTHPTFLRWMYKRHVFRDMTRLTPDLLAYKHHITQQSGARFAPAAFVTGGLDPMDDRHTWLEMGRSLSQPVQAIVASQGPPKSKAEMLALAALPQVESHEVAGTLGLHEEYAEIVGAIALKFLQS